MATGRGDTPQAHRPMDLGRSSPNNADSANHKSGCVTNCAQRACRQQLEIFQLVSLLVRYSTGGNQPLNCADSMRTLIHREKAIINNREHYRIPRLAQPFVGHLVVKVPVRQHTDDSGRTPASLLGVSLILYCQKTLRQAFFAMTPIVRKKLGGARHGAETCMKYPRLFASAGTLNS